jgi:acyl carrier protein
MSNVNSTSRAEVWDATVSLLRQLAEDWDYSGEIGEDTLMFGDLGFQSLDAVVLGNTLQERFGRPIPFADLLTTIGQREINDVTIAEWVDFTYNYLLTHTAREAV